MDLLCVHFTDALASHAHIPLSRRQTCKIKVRYARYAESETNAVTATRDQFSLDEGKKIISSIQFHLIMLRY